MTNYKNKILKGKTPLNYPKKTALLFESCENKVTIYTARETVKKT